MTVEQKKIAHKDIILLDMGEVMEITGWCEKVVRNLFAYDEDFPAIKIGKNVLNRKEIFVDLHSEKSDKSVFHF